MGWLQALGLGKEIVSFAAGLFGRGDRKEIASALAIQLASKLRDKIDRGRKALGDRQQIAATEVWMWLDGLEDYVSDAAAIAAVLGVTDKTLPPGGE